MSTPSRPPTDLQDEHLSVRVQLAAAWTSFMFLYAYVDILGLYLPGVIDDILTGVVWQFEISQTWAAGALTLMAVPISMIMLSVVLPPRASRTSNLVVASLYLPITAGNAVGESWTYYFALAVALEATFLVLILRCAWTWPRTPPPSTDFGHLKPTVDTPTGS